MTTFHVELSPQRRDDRLHLEKRGATLLFNGEVVDPSAYDDSAPVSQWIVGRPEAVDGGWSVTIILPHGFPAPRASRFPVPIVVSADGPVQLPPYEGPDEDQEALCAAVEAKLSGRAKYETTANGEINIPVRLTLGEMPKGVYFSETASPFHRCPEYGAVVAHVIATASLLELEMLRLAVSQHGSEALFAVRTAFKHLPKDLDRRIEYIKSVARSTGQARVEETIVWAYNYSKPVFTIRHRFAHHIWGECPALPNTLLLAAPMDILTGHAAHSQLLGHRHADAEAQILWRIASGEGGSTLSDADQKAVFEMASARQNDPGRIEAFNMTIDHSDFRTPAAEVWTANDFENAALAAELARTHVLGPLQQIAQWLDGLRAEGELGPLPATSPGNRKR